MPDDQVKRVLVIEDNETDVRLIKEALEKYAVRFELSVISDGQKALEHLKHIAESPTPQLIILDLNMPKHDGIEVLVQYRMTVALFEVPIVVLTSSDSPSDRLRTKNIGVSAFIRKPMGLPEFIALGKRFKTILETPYLYQGPLEKL
jgi:CheY-like chemotaxis protein